MRVTLQQIARVKAGHPFRGAIPEQKQGNGYVIQLRDVDADARICLHNLVCTNVTGRREPEWLKQGNIIFSARGTRNLASVVPEMQRPVVSSPHFFVVELTETTKVLPEFLAWQLNQPELQKYFQKSAEGSVQASIRKGVLEQAEIILPELSKQRQIVELLNKALEEKKVLERLIELRRLEIGAVAKNILK